MVQSGFYAVRVGREQGVYNSWKECEANVKGYSGAIYKKFGSYQEAQSFANGSSSNSSRPSYSNSYGGGNGGGYSRSSYSNSYTSYNDNRYNDLGDSYGSRSNLYGNSTSPYTPSFQGTHDDNDVIVYTDGASSGNGTANARAGFGVYYGDNDPRNVSERLCGRQTNQRAEAMAVIRALEQTQNESRPVQIMTDSQYVIKATNEWSQKWVKNGWRNANGQPVENRDVLERIIELKNMRGGHTNLVYVPGHSGHHGNEMADRLAVNGARLPN